MVPAGMQEWYGYAGLSRDRGITGTATYSDFRRFETGVRLILR